VISRAGAGQAFEIAKGRVRRQQCLDERGDKCFQRLAVAPTRLDRKLFGKHVEGLSPFTDETYGVERKGHYNDLQVTTFRRSPTQANAGEGFAEV
jgi:hypothetical protein